MKNTKYRKDPATGLQGSYMAAQQHQALEIVSALSGPS